MAPYDRTSAGPRSGGAGAEHLLASAERLHEQLLAGLEVWGDVHGSGARRAAPKLMAVVALALETRRLVRRPRAIQLAAQAVGRSRGMSPGAQKKAASEARALLSHPLASNEAQAGAESDGELLERLDALFAPLNLQQALVARAIEHAGGRGGRPPRTAGEVCAEIRRLMALADAGDRAAYAELMTANRQMQTWVGSVLSRMDISKTR